MKGLFFYKKISPYKEDITLNCKLNITQIDDNFFNLKEMDIKDGYINNNSLILQRVNDEEIEIDISELLDGSNVRIDYDSLDGIINIYKNGELIKTIDKLITKDNIDIFSNFLVAHDNTLIGDGTEIYPLRVSPLEETNFYPMVKSLINYADNREDLPTNPNIGDRYVYKTFNNPFGILYNKKTVDLIANELKLSGWRVPTLDEWNQLLNTVDCVKNHGESLTCNVEYGKYAGHLLKSVNFWKEPTIDENNSSLISFNIIKGIDKYGMTIVPSGKGDEGRQHLYFHEAGLFWTTNIEPDNDEVYAKEFNYNIGGVYQRAISKNDYASLRLVKDFNGSNYMPFEYIKQQKYKTVKFNNLIWLGENFKHIKDNYEYIDVDYDAKDLVKYSIVEWDGQTWLEKELADENRLIIENAPNGKNKCEYKLSNGELVENTIQGQSEITVNENDPLLKIDNNVLSSVISIKKNNDYSYSLIGKDNDKSLGDIIIPQTSVITDGEFIESATEADKENDDSVIVGNPYIKFTLTNGNYIYIPLTDIFKPYTIGNGLELEPQTNTLKLKLNNEKNSFLQLDENGLYLNIFDFKYYDNN